MPRKISSCSIAMNLRAVVEKASLLGTPDSQSRGQGCSPFWVSGPQHPGWSGLAPLTIRTLIAPLLFHLQSTFFWLLYCFHNFGHFFFNVLVFPLVLCVTSYLVTDETFNHRVFQPLTAHFLDPPISCGGALFILDVIFSSLSHFQSLLLRW